MVTQDDPRFFSTLCVGLYLLTMLVLLYDSNKNDTSVAASTRMNRTIFIAKEDNQRRRKRETRHHVLSIFEAVPTLDLLSTTRHWKSRA